MSTPEGGQATLTCTVCGEDVTGPASGRGGVSMKFGTHMWVKHQIRASGKAKAGDVDEQSIGDQPRAISLVRSISDGVGRTRKSTPTTDDLANGLGRGLSLSSVFVASLFLDGDDTLSDAGREQWIENLSFEQRAAKDLMHPIGRALSGTKANARYGRAVVDNVDVLSSVFELGLWAQQWRRYFALRAATAAAAGPPGPVWQPAYADPGQPAVPVEVAFATPPPQAGVVIGPDDVAKLRAQQAGQ